MVFDILTFIVMVVLLAVVIFIIIKLGALPGKIAEEREHPQAEAINVCGWIGILTLGVAWPVALIWAYLRPTKYVGKASDSDSTYMVKLEKRIGALEEQIHSMTTQKGGARP